MNTIAGFSNQQQKRCEITIDCLIGFSTSAYLNNVAEYVAEVQPNLQHSSKSSFSSTNWVNDYSLNPIA